MTSPARGTARAHDGFPQAVTRFTARGRPWASPVIASAMGVRQELYAPLATFLAEHGIHVITFDYRGTFSSRTTPLLGYFPGKALRMVGDLDLHARYGRARVERRHVEPSEVGRRSIAHFGFFAEASRDTLWAEALARLRAAIPAPVPARAAEITT